MTNIAWSMATFALTDIPVMYSISCYVLPKIELFAPQNISNISWAFAKLIIGDVPLLSALAAAALLHMC